MLEGCAVAQWQCEFLLFMSDSSKKHESMQLVLEMINYLTHNWNIYGDLKVVALLLGLQLGYIQHMCLLCLWNSRDVNNHYEIKHWPPRVEHSVGRNNVQHEERWLIRLKSIYHHFILNWA